MSIQLGPDFTERLRHALPAADTARRRRVWVQRTRRILPLVLLTGPIVAWRLLLATSGSAHVVVDALASLTFFLDISVRIDTAVLSYLGLQALPTLTGTVLLILLSASLLRHPRGKP